MLIRKTFKVFIVEKEQGESAFQPVRVVRNPTFLITENEAQ